MKQSKPFIFKIQNDLKELIKLEKFYLNNSIKIEYINDYLDYNISSTELYMRFKLTILNYSTLVHGIEVNFIIFIHNIKVSNKIQWILST